MKLIFRTLYFTTILSLTGCNPFKDYSIVNLMQEGLIWENGTTTYNLGDVGVGSIKSKTFVLTNKSNLRAINCQTPNITNSTDFTIDSTTCTSEMEPFASCEVVILASPQSQGLKDVNIERSCDLDSSRMNPVTPATVNAIVSNLVWSPLTNDFGALAVAANTSETTFTLTNNGSTTPTSCSAPSLSNTTDFEITEDNCGTNDLAPAATCTVKVKGHPQSTGLKTATLSRSCGVGGTVSTTSNMIKVTGTTSPNLAWTPLTNSFGSVNVGSNSSTQVFTLNNSGNGAATGCSTPTISDTTNFTITANTCGTNDVTASGSCTLTVRANPTTVGLKSASISRTCSVGGTVSTTSNQITTTGTTSPNLAWTPLTNSFGSVNVGSNSSTQIFSLNNSGNGDATTCGLATLSNVTDFTITADSCGLLDVAVSGSCNVTVQANPASSGVKATTLSRTCSVGGTVSTTSNQITTTGTVAPNLAWIPLTNDFGNVSLGSNSSAQVFSLANSGTGPASGCSAPTISDTTNFTIATDACGTSDVASSASCIMTVRANPTTVGLKSATISRTCTVGGTVATTSNQITATGFVATPSLAWSPLTYDFGSVNTGFTSLQSFTLSNSGTADATGCSTPTVSDTTNFSIVTNNCGTSNVVASGNCDIVLQANPTTAGLKTATVSRTCSVGGTVTTTTNQITVTGYTPSSYADWKQSFNIVSFNTVRSGGTSNAFSYYFRNINSTGLTGCTSPTLTNSTDFSIVSDSCSIGAMGAATLCEVKVQANPISIGVKAGSLVRSCTETGSVTISLNAIASSAAQTVGLDAGGDQSCSLQSDGTVKCWGYNSSGQLGDGTTTNRTTAVVVSGISTATQVISGNSHSCALLADRTIKCWGQNSYGQLGDGTNTQRTTPVTVSGISNALYLSEGAYTYHTCAVLTDLTVKCWGYNVNGQLGDGTTTNRNSPVVVSGISTASLVTVGDRHSCAVLTDNTIKCWGANNAGQLGDGTTTQRTAPVLTVSGITNATQVTAGQYHTCALLSDETIKCWGNNSFGVLGNGTNTNSITPVLVSGISTATQISAGQSFNCALLSDGTIKCWGDNISAQLGDQTMTRRNSPVSVVGISTATVVNAGAWHSCALLADQTAKCWGVGSGLRSGDGATSIRIAATAVPGITTATQVEQGYWHTCARLSDSTIKCWGNGTSGQLGSGTQDSYSTPISVLGITNATQVSVGTYNTCATLNDGTVKCWGDNGLGSVGDGTTTHRTSPTLVSGISTATQVAVGEWYFGCALLADGTVQCWGSNDQGQLGDGTTTTRTSPVTVSGLAGAVQISSGNRHSCAVLNDNTIKCWGYNWGGQIGDGTTTNRTTAVLVSGITNAIQVVTGGSHTCALLADQTVMCWGANSYGQIGQTPGGSVLTPSLVSGITNVTQVALGKQHSCALLSDGKSKCWGDNSFGQLGDITTTSYFAPAYRLGVSAISSTLATGSSAEMQCSINAASEILCTGNNNYSQTGFDETVLRNVNGL